MNLRFRLIPLLFLCLWTPGYSSAGEIAEEENGLVAIEIESTDSPLGNWEKKTDLSGFSGESYLEFTGNTPTNGPADSPLAYRFSVERGGLYYFHLHCARETVGKRTDLANDAYIRLEGDFDAGPNPGDKHGMDAPLDMLKQDTKFFGGDDNLFVWASGNRLDPGGHNNKRVAVYHLKAGETYTLIVSGRSQLFKADCFVFRHESLPEDEVEILQSDSE
ncbi:MAG: hypothetical protein AAF733_01765 [Verrucomicrobiota bacterium]